MAGSSNACHFFIMYDYKKSNENTCSLMVRTIIQKNLKAKKYTTVAALTTSGENEFIVANDHLIYSLPLYEQCRQEANKWHGCYNVQCAMHVLNVELFLRCLQTH